MRPLSENIPKKNTPSIPYTKIEDVFDHSDAIVHIYDRTLRNHNISSDTFEKYLEALLQRQGQKEEEVIGTEMRENTFFIYFQDGGYSTFSIVDLQNQSIQNILGNTSKKILEKEVQDIHSAIENIYHENAWYIWNGDINDDDTLKINKYGRELKGKTLKDLKKLLDTKNKKLYQVYDITKESTKKQELLKNEIRYFVWVGNNYEWGAKYFALSQKDIQQKVNALVENMSFEQIFSYIRQVNKEIENNDEKSDLVNQTNLKLINSLYQTTFSKLKKQNAKDQDFVGFIKAITGRWDITEGKNGDFEYIQLEIDTQYKSIDIANKALIHLMYREGGILENIEKNTIEIAVQDPEVSQKSPASIIDNTIVQLEKISPGTPNYGQQVLTQAGIGNLIGTSKNYDELSFQEKVNIGTLDRISQQIQKDGTEMCKQPEYVYRLMGQFLQESFDELNESLSENFDSSILDWNGTSATDLWLSWDMAEVFELYQDINGNKWLFDLSDKNLDLITPWTGTVVLWVGLIAGAIVFGPIIAAASAGAVVGGWTLFLAGAKVGAIVGIASTLLSEKWYDTTKEAVVDSTSQIVVDSIVWWAFAWAGLSLLIRMGKINPNLLIGREAWLRPTWLTDKWFIVGEVSVTGFVINPAIWAQVEKWYSENHGWNTDTHHIVNNKVTPKILK